MFNFTTQTVFNSITASTLTATSRKPAKGANLIIGATGDNPTVRIGNVRFTKGQVLDIQVKNPTVENLAKVEFDLSKVLTAAGATADEAGSYRITLYIGLSMNSQDSFYSNDFVYKGKPFYIEFPVNAGDTAANVAKKAVAIAKKYLLFMTQEKILDVTADGTKISIEGVNGYQIIKKANLQKFNPDHKKIDCCSNEGGFEDIVIGVPVTYTTDNDGIATTTTKVLDESGELRDLADNEVAIAPGIEAFGDYSWIIHNLRLPTAANTNFWAPTKDEMPVVGATYKQYVIRMINERDGIAGGVVGERATSVTTHVLYVNTANTAAITTLENALKSVLNKTSDWKTDADSVLKAPYATVTSGD